MGVKAFTLAPLASGGCRSLPAFVDIVWIFFYPALA
jgi:hypothetical protein